LRYISRRVSLLDILARREFNGVMMHSAASRLQRAERDLAQLEVRRERESAYFETYFDNDIERRAISAKINKLDERIYTLRARVSIRREAVEREERPR